MSSENRGQGEIMIEASGLGKAYHIYRRPQDRLKQMLFRWKRFYEEYWAFQNVDLTIRRGETLGIIGRNGSGKSTLLQVIAGTLQPSAGTISSKGRIAPLLELGTGFNPEFTGRENVTLAATVLGLSRAEVEQRFDSILEFAGIGDFIDQQVKTYSSGMYARLAFAVAAHVDADILIVDEILAVGDAAFTQKCMRFIREFKKTGTLLFVSHDTSSVNALCDRAIWMENGQIRAEGEAKDVSLAYQASLGNNDNGFTISGRRRQTPHRVETDFRHQKIAASDKRNVMEVFEFDPDGPSYGQRGGKIVNVRFVDTSGDELTAVEGGETVVLEIECAAYQNLDRPIVGFYVRDRLGQNLFGDNTFLDYESDPTKVLAGQHFQASFSFRMPYLPPAEYSVCAALADGTQTDHVQHHWLDEALIFRCENGHVRLGLMGVPMNKISLSKFDGPSRVPLGLGDAVER